MQAQFIVDEETQTWMQFEIDLVQREPKLVGPPIEYTLTKDGWTYTLMLAGVQEKKAFYRLVTKRKLLG